MTPIWNEMLIIALLIIINGLFTMAEMALVSARKSRIQKLAEEGNKGAKVALELMKNPTRFLSTIQFGITLITIFSGAFGGVAISQVLAETLKPLPIVGPYADPVSLASVVFIISVLSLIFGELVPKRLALSYSENISIKISMPVDALSSFAGPVVKLFSAITDAALNAFNLRQKNDEPPISDEELRLIIKEGTRAGVFQKSEKEMFERVLTLDDVKVGDIMTPRTRIVWLDIEEPDENNWRKVVASGHANFPVYQHSQDNVVGCVSVKALWANLSLAQKADLKTLLTEPLFVPTSMTAMKLLENFRQKGQHFALVADEFGGVEGLVSINDVMEAIVGELPSKDQQRRHHQIRKKDDNTWIIDAMVDIEKLKILFSFDHLPEEDSEEYQTVGGFVISRMGRIPSEGDFFEFNGYKFEVIDMDKHRIDKVIVTRLGKNAPN